MKAIREQPNNLSQKRICGLAAKNAARRSRKSEIRNCHKRTQRKAKSSGQNHAGETVCHVCRENPGGAERFGRIAVHTAMRGRNRTAWEINRGIPEMRGRSGCQASGFRVFCTAIVEIVRSLRLNFPSDFLCLFAPFCGNPSVKFVFTGVHLWLK